MRLSLMWLVVSMHMSVFAIGQHVTLNQRNASLATVLKEIKRQTGYHFLYDAEAVLEAPPISLTLKNVPVEEALKQCLEGLSLKFVINQKNIIISKQSSPVAKPEITTQRTVTGRVTDTNGTPLEGVTVSVMGTAIATTTDNEGTYRLVLPSEVGTIVFTIVGYARYEADSSSGDVINVSLREEISDLEEVVVVGYGTQNKSTLTGAVSAVSEEQLGLAPAGDAASRLQGRVSGVTVTNNNSPGGSATVRVRGIGSINNNNPLYVVDGVPISGGLNAINPNDIETMTVLKDASSSAIYGSRAANGVIVITTKSGKGGKLKLDFSGRYGLQNPMNKLDLLNSQELGEKKWQEKINDGLTPESAGWGDLQYGYGPDPVIPDYTFPQAGKIGEVDENLYSYPSPYYGITKANKAGTDWLDEIFNTASIQEYNFSVRGGGENSSYFISSGLLDQRGIVRETGFRRYSVRSNSSFKITNWLEIGQNLGVSYSDQNGLRDGDVTAAITSAMNAHPILPVYDIKGNFAGTKSPGTGNGHNPVAQLIRGKNNYSRETRILGNVYAQANFTKDLSFRSTFGTDLNNNKAKVYTLRNPEFTQTNLNNGILETHLSGFQFNWSNTLTFSKILGDNHHFDLLIGTEAIKHTTELFNAGRSSYAFEDEDFMILDAGEENFINAGNFDSWSLFSYFSRLNYNYNGKYLLEAVVRRDGSSRFTKANRWGTFPALSAGWRALEDLGEVSFIDDLKLRVGWGQNGNDNVGNYNAYSTFRSHGFESYYNISGSSRNRSEAGIAPFRLGNLQGRWETNTTTNAGVDLMMFNRKLEVNFDVFTRRTTDMLYPDTRPATWGALELASINVGEMKNSGFDLMVAYRHDIGETWHFNASANLSHYKNKAINLNGNPNEIRYGSQLQNDYYTITQAGIPISSHYGYVVEGFFNTQEEIDAHPKFNPNLDGIDTYSKLGVFKYKDVNNDGVVNQDDRTIIGSPHPDFTYGINLYAQYKGLVDLTIFFQGSQGNDIANFAKRTILFNRNDGNYLKSRLYESWTPERYANGERITLPITTNNDAILQRPSTFFVEDGSYFRLKDVQLGFNVPDGALSKLRASSLRIFLQATNLFTVTEYSGLDPELSSGNDSNLGVDSTVYPTPRMFTFGINMNF
ncbi:TonB-dependent receptor [Parapedobacter luteus]|nr:TonB-dependent receptor [Parapedobacter luteus]